MQEITERPSKTRPAIPCLFQVATLLEEKNHAFHDVVFNYEHRVAHQHGTLGCR